MMKSILTSGRVRSIVAVAMLTAVAAASISPARAESVDGAKSFLKTMMLNQFMGLPQNGSVNISEVDFNDDCHMVMTGSSRFFVVQVNFAVAIFDSDNMNVDGTPLVTRIIVEGGATVYRGGNLIQQADTSTIDISFSDVHRGARIERAINTLHNACYRDPGHEY